MATFPDAFETPDRTPSQNAVASSFRLGGVWVLVLRGEVDLDVIGPVRDQVAQALRDEGVPVLFDLGQVTFCDSTTLNLLLHTSQQTTVGLLRPSAWVERLLDVTGVHELLPSFGTAEEAVEALAPARDTPCSDRPDRSSGRSG
jgi:anti-sigma B factor antagonist